MRQKCEFEIFAPAGKNLTVLSAPLGLHKELTECGARALAVTMETPMRALRIPLLRQSVSSF